MKQEAKKLLNGCSRSAVFISPKNYKSLSSKSAFPKNWFVQCRFFDPNHAKEFQYRKKFSSEDLQELKLTAEIFKEEMELMLDVKNFNPITKQYMTDRRSSFHPYMPFIDALKKAHEKLAKKYTEDYSYEVGRCITNIDKIKESLGFENLLINEIRTWHVKNILDEMNLPNSSFNKFRTYLLGLFKELTELGCSDINPVRDLSKKVETITIREVITKKKLSIVLKYLKKNYYTFYRYAQVFHYSAARSTELFSVQKKHINLEDQEYTVLIKKGKQYVWVKKIIIPAAIPFWTEIIGQCKNEEDYIFSKGLLPGTFPIKPYQITKRWKRLVKDSKKIIDPETKKVITVTEDFYTLKHLFLDLLDEMNSTPVIPIAGPAQRMANHTTEDTTDIYTKGKNARKNEDLKRLMIS